MAQTNNQQVKGATPPARAAAPPRPGQRPMGFRKVGAATGPRRMIVSIYGPQKSGKNHFAFQAPGPIGYHSFDYGDEGVIEKFVAGLVEGVPPIDIEKAEYIVNIPTGAGVQETSNACTPAWNAFTTNYSIGVGRFRSQIVDTNTDAYEMIRMSYFGKLTQVMPHHYAPVNAEFKSLFRLAYSTPGHNLVMLARHKEEWINKLNKDGKEVGTKTGNWVFAGYSQTPYEVQVHMRSFRDDEGFGMEIEDCRQNPDLMGTVLRGDMLNWWTLGQLVFPESTEEEWR